VNVALVTLRFDAPGGVETTVRELARGLAQSGDRVEVFASDLYDEARWDRRPNLSSGTWDGVRVSRFPVFKRLVPGLTLPLMVGLVDALSRSRIDILHAHSHRYGHVLQSGAVARRRGLPFVVSTHYHPPDRREPTTKRMLLKLQDVGFGASAYRVARALVVETRREAAWIGAFAPAERIRVIPPGIDLESWERDSECDAPTPIVPDLPPEYLLYAGRVASNKGLDILVRALSRLPPSERIPLVAVGHDWGERERLDALARSLGVADSVRWLGHVPDPAVYRRIFRRARLFVLPSEYEAFGLVLLEAMAAGVPIVATAVGGVPEVLEEGRTGALVPYGNPGALADTLSSLLREPERAEAFARRGRERVREFGWSRMVERYRALYAELLAAR
jgi:starch synthase